MVAVPNTVPKNRLGDKMDALKPSTIVKTHIGNSDTCFNERAIVRVLVSLRVLLNTGRQCMVSYSRV